MFNELCKGVISEASKRLFFKIINQLIAEGAQGVILGCTEIGMLIQQQDLSIPVFDTTDVHVEARVDFALNTSKLKAMPKKPVTKHWLF